MTEALLKKINYDFRMLMGQINAVMERLHPEDKYSVLAWITKLKEMGQNIQELHLRNKFLDYLLSSIIYLPKDNRILPPFNKTPPFVLTETTAAQLLVNYKPREPFPGLYSKKTDDHQGKEVRVCDRNELFCKSPDRGAFLQAQPVPRSGTFCYLAVVSHNPPQS